MVDIRESFAVIEDGGTMRVIPESRLVVKTGDSESRCRHGEWLACRH
jgi:hypothetical protein